METGFKQKVTSLLLRVGEWIDKHKFLTIFIFLLAILLNSLIIFQIISNRDTAEGSDIANEEVVQEEDGSSDINEEEVPEPSDEETEEDEEEEIETPQSKPESVPRKERLALVINYLPIIEDSKDAQEYFGWSDPNEDIAVYVQDLNSFSDYKYKVVETITDSDFPVKEDGFEYTAQQYKDCINNSETCHMPDTADYGAIEKEYGICERINDKEIDEVWIMGGPYFGFYESTLIGPADFAFYYNSGPQINDACNRLVPVMGFSYERPDSLLHNFGHRTESTLTQLFGGWEQNQLINPMDKFGMNAAQSPDYSFSGCGSVHYAPNSKSDYDYSNNEPIESYCDEFANYPNIDTDQRKVVTCEDWGCDGEQHMIWWLGKIPNNPGKDSNGIYNDWWRYIIDPNNIYLD
jgi:hypothetical protein